MTNHPAWLAQLIDAPLHDQESAVRALEGEVAAGESSAVDRALTYLEADPYYFRSGYARRRLAGRVASATLTPGQKQRARLIVLRAVDGTLFWSRPGIPRLAANAADNALRRESRARLHGDGRIAWRAMHVLLHVRHPGFTTADLSAVREIALRNGDVRAAKRVWSSAWEAELRALMPHHDPQRAAAKELLRRVKYNKQRRAGP